MIPLEIFMGGSRGEQAGVQTPPENHRNIGFLSNTGPDLLKYHKATKPALCWAIVGTPAKRHVNGDCWRADNDPRIVVLGPTLPSSTKRKLVKFSPPLTKLSGSAHCTITLWANILLSLFIGYTVNVLKFRTLNACLNGIDKQGRPRSSLESDQGFLCLLF